MDTERLFNIAVGNVMAGHLDDGMKQEVINGLRDIERDYILQKNKVKVMDKEIERLKEYEFMYNQLNKWKRG